MTTPATALVPIAPPTAPMPLAALPPPSAAPALATAPAPALVAAAVAPALAVVAPAALAVAPAAPAPPLAPPAVAPPPAPPKPSLPRTKLLNATSRPAGASAAIALSLLRTWVRKSAHSSQSRTWRRTGPETLRSPSAASASSSRTSPQVSWRAWLASASEIRARTSSDLTEGTLVSIVEAISS